MLTQNNKLLDEFEDVSETEKEFMKLWNPFIFKQRIFADWSAALCHAVPCSPSTAVPQCRRVPPGRAGCHRRRTLGAARRAVATA